MCHLWNIGDSDIPDVDMEIEVETMPDPRQTQMEKMVFTDTNGSLSAYRF